LKIATNTPFSFGSSSDCDFVQLGGEVSNISMIVLMLEKNWGSSSIEKIRALTYWVSSYPQTIPCYLIGCESTIPSMELSRYLDRDRDDSIRDLCNEVLKRSNSIGVRGKITYTYLVEVLGYEKHKIDIIFQKGSSDNLGLLNKFLIKNNCPIIIEEGALAFQSNPYVVYERPIVFEQKIVISQPYVNIIGDTARLSSDINIDGQIKTLYCETSIKYSKFLLSERTDAFLSILLPFAMRSGKDITCNAPVSEYFLHNLCEILIPQLCAHDNRLYSTKLFAVGDSAILDCGGSVATGMSCGVDSFYTVNLYKSSKFKSMNLSHLYCGNYLYGNDGPIYERAELASEDLGLPLIRTATNINEILRLPHQSTHFFKIMFGVLALRKLFRIYYYSTAEDFSHFNLKNNGTSDTVEIELLLLYVFTCPDFQVLTGGAKSERLEKTSSISNLATARKLLNVCLYPEKTQNCGKCEKCRRTLLMLDMLDSLDLFEAVFDTDEYRKDRLGSFVYLIRQKNSVMLSGVYQHFLKVEPDLIKQAETKLALLLNAQK
jgi:hypothetical protein